MATCCQSDSGHNVDISGGRSRSCTGPDRLHLPLLIRQRFDAGEFLAFEEFEAGAAAGGDVGDLVGYAGLVDGGDRVAAADDADGGLVGRNGMGDGCLLYTSRCV